MRGAMLGAFVGAGLVMAAVGAFDRPGAVFAQRPSPVAASNGDAGLIALPSMAVDHGQLVTVIEPKSQVMSVYHIDATSGRIKLLSVRNIHWDLQMVHLNSENPLPQEIRSLLEQR